MEKRRPSREITKDSKRLSALEQLRTARETGTQIQYTEEELVYDYVDEEKYSSIVRERQNFIIDGEDDDGREIFEKRTDRPIKRKKDIRSLIKSSKTKVVTHNLGEDDLLKDIMKELHEFKDDLPKIPSKHDNLFKNSTNPQKIDFSSQRLTNIGKFENFSKNERDLPKFSQNLTEFPEDMDVPGEVIPEYFEIGETKEIVQNYNKIPTTGDDSPKFASQRTQDLFSDGEDEILRVMSEVNTVNNSEMNSSTDGTLFYWLDAYDEYVEQNGVLYLFGKTLVNGKLVNTTLLVENVLRIVYITTTDVNDDFCAQIEQRLHKQNIKDYQMRPTTKKHTDSSVSGVEVEYSAKHPLPPGDDVVWISPLEYFLLERRMKGPCWLKLSNVRQSKSPISWTNSELLVSHPSSVIMAECHLPPTLPLVLLYLRLSMKDSVIMGVDGLINRSYPLEDSPKRLFDDGFCIVVGSTKQNNVETVPNERALLGLLLGKLHKIDPDVIAGHSLIGYWLQLILQRMKKNKVQHWSKLGRIRRATYPKMTGVWKDVRAVCGRIICDLNISVRELIHLRSYEMGEIVQQVVKEEYHDWDIGHVGCRQGLQVLKELNVLPLALQITRICGNLMAHTLVAGRSERNEYLLLHAFHQAGFLPFLNQTQARHDRKPTYEGGLVLEPKKGFYDTLILLMDFNSLYPSIIQEFNVCFTTKLGEDRFSDDRGVLPSEIKKLVDSRREIKKLMKERPEPQYNIRQQALKLIANSMYGCLGFSNNRFYEKDLASFITAQGRKLLTKTKELVEGMGLEVLYGDTDSLMINSNTRDVHIAQNLALKIKQSVNKLYKHLEIEVDGIFTSLLLLKKKKYAALQLSQDGSVVKHVRGIDTVRRDWCPLSRQTGNEVVDLILSGLSREHVIGEIHDLLVNVAASVNSGGYPLSLYAITKQLAKNPGNYGINLPHVAVALRMNEKGGAFKAGDAVEYIICNDGTSHPATQRAYHPSEVDHTRTVDYHYYLANQIHPVVSRLCIPIDGTSSTQLAQALGVSMTVVHTPHVIPHKFHPLVWDCPSCSAQITSPSEGLFLLDKCVNPECTDPPLSYVPFIENVVVTAARKFISKYYEGWMVCDDCYARTRLTGLTVKLGKTRCPTCRKGTMAEEYSSAQLYFQINYYRTLFDLENAAKSVYLVNQMNRNAYNRLLTRVDNILSYSAYSNVDLSSLFCNLFRQ